MHHQRDPCGLAQPDLAPADLAAQAAAAAQADLAAQAATVAQAVAPGAGADQTSGVEQVLPVVDEHQTVQAPAVMAQQRYRTE